MGLAHMAAQQEDKQTQPQPSGAPEVPSGQQPTQPLSQVAGYADVPPPPQEGTQSPQPEQPAQPPVERQAAAQPQPTVPPPQQPGVGEAPPPQPPPTQPAGQAPATDAPTQMVSPAGGRKFPIKIIVLGLVGLVLIAAIAFGARQFLASRQETGQSLAPAGTAPRLETVLTYWGLWEDPEIVAGVIAEYEEQNPRIKINYIKQSKEDYRERLTNTLARGSGAPDIFRYHNTWVPMFKNDLDSLPPEVMDAQAYLETFYLVAQDSLSSGTNLVGIPLMFDGLALYINEELFTASGKSVPATWDDLRAVAQELTVTDEEGRIQQAGVALGRTDNVEHWQDILALMMLQNGADLSNPTGKLAEDALSFFTVFTTEDKVWDETLPPSTQAFATGKVAMYFGPSWRAFELRQLDPNLKFKTVPVPQLPKASAGEPDITWGSFWAEGVWAKSQNKKEAWQFLKYLSSKEALQKTYEAASKTRLFGEPYPRQDMASLLVDDPLVGAFVKQGPTAKFWYLTSRTFDGKTGINSALSGYFEDAVNAVVNDGKEPAEVLPTVAAGVREVFARYNMTVGQGQQQ